MNHPLQDENSWNQQQHVNYLSTSSSTQASNPSSAWKKQHHDDEIEPADISNNPSLISSNWVEGPSRAFAPSSWIEPRETLYYSNKPWIPLLCSLLVPGSGHLLIGQFKKAAFYMSAFYTFLLIAISLCIVYVGFFLLPLVFAYYVVIFMDLQVLVNRLENAHAIMEGECGNKFALWGLIFVVEKPFMTGDMANAPEEYINRY